MAITGLTGGKRRLTVQELINRLERLGLDKSGLKWEKDDGVTLYRMTVYNPLHEADEQHGGVYESLSFQDANGEPAIIIMMDGFSRIVEQWEKYIRDGIHYKSYIFTIHTVVDRAVKLESHTHVDMR